VLSVRNTDGTKLAWLVRLGEDWGRIECGPGFCQPDERSFSGFGKLVTFAPLGNRPRSSAAFGFSGGMAQGAVRSRIQKAPIDYCG